MCVGHPKRHPCQHTSVNYNHCVAAHFDRHTRLTTPCHNTTYAAPVDSDSKCTNQLCYFEELGGSWICCQCNNGPNNVGWCIFHRPRVELNAITGQPEQLTTCDHCCCWNCTSYCESINLVLQLRKEMYTYIWRHYSGRTPRRLKPWRWWWIVEASETPQFFKAWRII